MHKTQVLINCVHYAFYISQVIPLFALAESLLAVLHKFYLCYSSKDCIFRHTVSQNPVYQLFIYSWIVNIYASTFLRLIEHAFFFFAKFIMCYNQTWFTIKEVIQDVHLWALSHISHSFLCVEIPSIDHSHNTC